MDRKQYFRFILQGIADKLSQENLQKLKFLCSDVIPAGDNEKILKSVDFFIELERRQKIAPNRLDFLHECLETIGRDDLATELKTFVRESECGIEAGKPRIGPRELDKLKLYESNCDKLRFCLIFYMFYIFYMLIPMRGDYRQN